MIRRAWSAGIKAKYALMDTWFVCGKMVGQLRKIGNGSVHLLDRMKLGREKVAIGTRR